MQLSGEGVVGGVGVGAVVLTWTGRAHVPPTRRVPPAPTQPWTLAFIQSRWAPWATSFLFL